MKKIFALILSLSMIVQCGLMESVFAAAKNNVAFEETFEGKTVSSVGASSTGIGLAEIIPDSTYGNSLHLYTDAEGSGGAGASYNISFPQQSMSGKIYFSLQYKKSTGWTSLYFGNTVNLYLNDGMFGSHLGTSTPGYMKLSKDEWHDIEVDFDIPAEKYDLYIDYEKVLSNVKFRSASPFSTFLISVSKNSDILLDNVKIVTENTTKAKDKAPEQTEQPTVTEAPASAEKTMITAGEGETVTEAIADTYIGMSGAVQAYGYKNNIIVTRDNANQEKLSFFKFIAPSVPNGKRAYLNLWLDSASYATENEVFTVYATETDWNENLASSDAPIKLIDTVGRKTFQKGEEKQWAKIDITDYVAKNSGKEISLSLRGNAIAGSTSLTFDSRENICKPNILVCDPIKKLEKTITGEMDHFQPIATEAALNDLPNTNAALREKEELNLYVIGNAYADIAVNRDIYGDFARKLSEKFSAKIHYINKAMSELIAQDAVDSASKLVEDQKPDLIILDFDSIDAKTAENIVEKYRSMNRYCEFIFAANQTDITGEGVLTLPRENLIGAEIKLSDSSPKAYIPFADKKYAIKEKDSRDIVDYFSMDDGFERKFVYENQKQYFSADEDTLIGGKYLHIKKDTARGFACGEYFVTPLGGNVRIDFQLCVFSPDTEFEMYLHPEGRQGNLTQIIFKNGVLGVGDNLTQVAEVECNQWYNIALLYNLQERKYDVVVNGAIAARDISAASAGTLGSIHIQINNGKTGDFAVDSIRTGYYREAERMLEPVEEPEESNEPKVLFDNNFDGEKPGLLVRGDAGTISYVKEGGNVFAHAERNKTTGGCSTMYSFEETKNDIVWSWISD